MSVVVSRVAFRRYDGPAALAALPRWVDAYAQVYEADLALPDHSDPPIRERIRSHAERPGFELVAAELPDGEIAGYLYGYTLQPDTLWWDGLEGPADPELTREWPGRTVGLCEGLVRPERQRDGLGERLLGAYLVGRTEERAAALVAETNEVLLSRLDRIDARVVGRLAPYPGWRPHHAIVLRMPTAR